MAQLAVDKQISIPPRLTSAIRLAAAQHVSTTSRVAGGSVDCQLPIADFIHANADRFHHEISTIKLGKAPIGNRQSAIGNPWTHPLLRGGTDLLHRRHTGCEVNFACDALCLKQVGPERLKERICEGYNAKRFLNRPLPIESTLPRVAIDHVVSSHSVPDIESFLLALANHHSKLHQLYAREI